MFNLNELKIRLAEYDQEKSWLEPEPELVIFLKSIAKKNTFDEIDLFNFLKK